MDFVKKHIEWLPALLITVILAGSLPYKFGNSPETQHIFNVVGEFLGLDFFKTLGGYIIGSAEALACILVLIPRTRGFGGALTVGIMAGAITFHIFSPLGIYPTWVEDGVTMQDTQLFYMACIAFLCGAWLALRHLDELLAFVGLKKA